MRRFVATFAWVVSAALAAEAPAFADEQSDPSGMEVRDQRAPTQKGRPGRPSRNGRKRTRPPPDGSPGDDASPDEPTPREKPPARAPKDVETALA
jgi:hypothetical protein